jgi:uncharacterized protein
MTELITALALAVVIEGLLYAAFPEQMKRAIMVVLDTPESQIRWVALTLAAAGLIVLAWVRL